MITFTNGDMFSINANYLVNTVNCVGVMGKGVALAFKNKYPLMFEEYKEKCNIGAIKPGHLHIWSSGDITVINFPTKRHWRNKSNYEDIRLGLISLKEYISSKKNVTLALPALGCGNGGLDWNIVSKMINEELSDINANIFVFEPSDSQSISKLSKPSSKINKKQNIIKNPKIFPHMYASYYGDIQIAYYDTKILLPSDLIYEKETNATLEIIHEIKKEKNTVISIIYNDDNSKWIVRELLQSNTKLIVFLLDTFEKYDNLIIDDSILYIHLTCRESINKNQLIIYLSSLNYRIFITEEEPMWFPSAYENGLSPSSCYFIKYNNTESFLKTNKIGNGYTLIGKSQNNNLPNISLLTQSFIHEKKFNTNISLMNLSNLEIKRIINQLDNYGISEYFSFHLKQTNNDKYIHEILLNIINEIKRG